MYVVQEQNSRRL